MEKVRWGPSVAEGPGNKTQGAGGWPKWFWGQKKCLLGKDEEAGVSLTSPRRKKKVIADRK